MEPGGRAIHVDTTVDRKAPDHEQLVCRFHESFVGYLTLGNEVVREPLARFVRNTSAPNIWDANFVAGARAETDAEIDAVLTRADELFEHCAHRHVIVDPWTPDSFQARLVLDGYEPHPELELLLEGELHAERAPAGIEIRPADSDDDWRSLARLLRLDHEEEAVKEHREVYAQKVTDQMVEIWKRKAPSLHIFIASVGDADCGFFHAWPGDNGVGKVEDLFTLPAFRHRGIATALIRRCVDAARAGGASQVMIGAWVNDTPKQMYAALGFRPFCVARSYLKKL